MIPWINLYKGFLILLVMLGHSSLVNESVTKIIYAFHMPAFFMISGYLYKKRDIKVHIIKRTQRLLVPYLYYVVFYCVIWLIVQYPTDWVMILLEFVTGRIELLWFLTCIYVVDILYNIIQNIFFKKYINYIIVLLVLIGYDMNLANISLPFYASISLYAIIYFHIGHVIHSYNLLDKISKHKEFYLLIILCIIIAIVLPTRLDLRNGALFPLTIKLSISLVLSIGMMVLCKSIKTFKVIEFIGKYSLDFYALNVFIPTILRYLDSRFMLNIGIYIKILSILLLLIIIWIKNIQLKKCKHSN